VKNSRVWEVTDTGPGSPAVLGRILSTTAQSALVLARHFWPEASTLRVKLVKQA
jgi:hypothetical protein